MSAWPHHLAILVLARPYPVRRRSRSSILFGLCKGPELAGPVHVLRFVVQPATEWPAKPAGPVHQGKCLPIPGSVVGSPGMLAMVVGYDLSRESRQLSISGEESVIARRRKECGIVSSRGTRANRGNG